MPKEKTDADVGPAIKDIPFYVKYIYSAGSRRDIFVPLLGGGTSRSSSTAPPNLTTLVLKGIIEGQGEQAALLVSGQNRYLLRDGKLYNANNQVIKGISGVIRKDSVVVMGRGTAKRLKLE